MPDHSASVARFHPDVREYLTAFVAQSPRIADLASTHPMLFVALATGYGAPRRRSAAIKAVLDGRRLRAVCEIAKIPFCLREVPAELCPVQLTPADWSRDASPVLAQLIPEDPDTLRNWVPAIFFANGVVSEPFALWLAKSHDVFAGLPLDHRRLLPIALYWWYARHPQHKLSKLVPGRWLAGAGLRRLLHATKAWLNRIGCRIHLPGLNEGEQHSAPFVVGPYHVVELTDYRSLLAEQQAMDNCLDRYGRRIASGSHAIFSLRTQSGVRVVNFEVAIHAKGGPLVCELKGRSNGEVSDAIRLAVEQWVATSPEMQRRPSEWRARPSRADAIFAQLISPYVESHAGILADLEPITLYGLERDLDELAARLDIKNWPVRFERRFGPRAGLMHPLYAPTQEECIPIDIALD